jgi:hypothetical protein
MTKQCHPRQEEITAAVMQELDAMLSSYGATRSAEQRDALREAADVFSAMAIGQAEPYAYISPVDVGIGKTTLVAAVARILACTKSLTDVGFLVFVEQHAQMKALRDQVGKVGVVGFRCSNDELMAKNGRKNPINYQTLVVTQEWLRVRSRDGSILSDMAELSYRGRPRLVRAWDEQLWVNEPISVHVRTIAALPSIVEKRFPKQANALQSLATELEAVVQGQPVTIPKVLRRSVDKGQMADALSSNSKWGDALRELQDRAGQSMLACTHGLAALVGFRPELPSDLCPIVAFDASARVSPQYELAQAAGQPIRMLSSAKWSYENVTVHIWNWPGSKSEYRSNPKPLIDATADVINREPGKKWLIIHHGQGSTNVEFEQEVRLRLHGIDTRAKFITYGLHRSTSDFRDYDRVVLAGTLFYDEPVVVAQAMAATGKDDSYPTTAVLSTLHTGVLLENILQGVGRSAVRNGNGRSSGSAQVYVIVHEWHKLKENLQYLLPGCLCQEWLPRSAPKRALRPAKRRRAADFVAAHFSGNPGVFLPIETVMAHVEIQKPDTFRKMVSGRREFKQTIKKAGIYAHTNSHSAVTGFADYRQDKLNKVSALND